MLTTIVAIALAAALPAGAPPASVDKDNAIAGLFMDDDYPPGSLDRDEQGTVEFNIHVNARGGVSGCEITKSSGFSELDAKTCEVVIERAKFIPARDAKGRAVPSVLSKTVTWRLEDDVYPSNPWSVAAVTTYGSSGEPSSCQITYLGGGSPAWRQRTPCLEQDISTLPHGTKSLEMAMQFVPGPATPPRLRRGDVIIARSIASLKIDETGSVSSCTSADIVGSFGSHDVCADAGKADYRPRLVAGKPAPFEGTIATTLIAHIGTAPAAGAPTP